MNTDPNPVYWWVPLGLKSQENTLELQSGVLDRRSMDIRTLDLKFYKLNDSASGFYRVKYPRDRLEVLGKQIANGHPNLNPSDRISLIGDSAALAISGLIPTMEFLSFLGNLKYESNFFVWDELLKCLSQLRCAWSEQPKALMTALRQFSNSLITAKAKEIGWDGTPGEDCLTSQLRSLLINEADFAQIEGYTYSRNMLRTVLNKKPK
jgi:aminopeptidase N